MIEKNNLNWRLLLLPIFPLLLTGCFETATAVKSAATAASSTSSNAMSPAAGAMSARIIFTNNATTGSFDDASVTGTGTAPGTGAGLRASRIFAPDNSLLASGSTSSSWPKWLNFVELGISGPSNSKALNANCARFSGLTESSTTCDYTNAGSGNTTCGAPAGYFRVSEADCAISPPTTGLGDSTDGVYLRAQFNRANLAAYENVMAVLQFVATTISPGPTSPTACFPGGVFNPNNAGCSDMTWQSYLKASGTLAPLPFMLIVPPSYSYFNSSTTSMVNANTATKQYYLPLGADTTLDTFQLSRIQARSTTLNPTAPNDAMCNPGGGAPPAGGWNSAMCLGMVFYSITFYRM